MTPSDDLIDLDVADEQSTAAITQPWRRWRRLVAVKVPVLGVVALVLAGVLAGAASMHLWKVTQQRSEVSLLLAATGAASAGGGAESLTITGTITVTNTGPMPVEVSGAANTAAFILQGQQQIAPDESAWFTATAIVSCPRDAVIRPLPVDLSVVTSDGRRRTVTVDLQLVGSSWFDTVALACSHMRNS